MGRQAYVWDSWWTRQAEPAAPLLGRKDPAPPRAGRGLRGTWSPARGAARGARIAAPVALGPGRGSCGGPRLPSHALPRQHTPCLPPVSLTCPSLLPFRYRSELLYFFACDRNLALGNFCLLGKAPSPSYRPLPHGSVLPPLPHRGPLPRARLSGAPDIPESSPRAGTRSRRRLLPSGWGGRGWVSSGTPRGFILFF